MKAVRWNGFRSSLTALALFSAGLGVTQSVSVAQEVAGPQGADHPAVRPNILLVLADDNSVPHDGCHRDPNIMSNSIVPNLRAFAAEGMCFDRAYSTAPQCAPSRESIFAGRNPVDLGVTRFGQPVRREIPYFTDLLRASGYWVGLEGRRHHLAGLGNEPKYIRQAMSVAGLNRIDDRFDYVNTFDTKAISPRATIDRLVSTIDRVPRGKPFFLYFGFNQTHREFVSNPVGIDQPRLVIPPDWPDLPEVRNDYAHYLSDLREMDTGMGLMIRMLKDKGLYNNTIIVFMGDNGESMYRGKGTLYERGNHVPLIIRWPGVATAGGHSDALVSGVDLAPTFLAAAGVSPNPKMSGVTMVPLLRGAPGNGRKYIFTERGWHFGSLNVSEGLDYSRAITADRYKLIYNAQPNQPYSPVDQGGRFNDRRHGSDGALDEDKPALSLTYEGRAIGGWRAVVVAHQTHRLNADIERIYFKRPRPIFELYDLANDKFELHNLAGQSAMATVETELRHQLDIWMIQNGDFLPLPTDSFVETPDPMRPKPSN